MKVLLNHLHVDAADDDKVFFLQTKHRLRLAVVAAIIKYFCNHANNVDPDETAQNEPSHQDLRCFPFSITKTCLYNFDPLKPHFYIVKLGLTGVYIFESASDS